MVRSPLLRAGGKRITHRVGAHVIDPRHMRKSIGRALFQHTKRRAEELGLHTLELSADPNAERFYERMGAKRIGEVPADVLENHVYCRDESRVFK